MKPKRNQWLQVIIVLLCSLITLIAAAETTNDLHLYLDIPFHSATPQTVAAVLSNVVIIILALFGYLSAKTVLETAAYSIFFCFFNYMLFMFAFGALTTYTEWNHIYAPAKKKVLYMLTFPLFMITYIPIALVALVKEASWKPIGHTISVDVEHFGKASRIPEE